MQHERSLRYNPDGEGFLKLYRKLLSSAVFRNSRLLHVWVWCLCRAKWREETVIFFQGEQLTLARGQFVTGRNVGSEQCNMKPSTWWDNLTKLEEMGNVTLESDSYCTVVTVLKYEAYQGELTDVRQPSENPPTTE